MGVTRRAGGANPQGSLNLDSPTAGRNWLLEGGAEEPELKWDPCSDGMTVVVGVLAPSCQSSSHWSRCRIGPRSPASTDPRCMCTVIGMASSHKVTHQPPLTWKLANMRGPSGLIKDRRGVAVEGAGWPWKGGG